MLRRLELRELRELHPPGVESPSPRAVLVASLLLVSAVLFSREHTGPAVPFPGGVSVAATRAGGLRRGAVVCSVAVVSAAATLGGATAAGTAAVRPHLPAIRAKRGRGTPGVNGHTQIPAPQMLRDLVTVKADFDCGVWPLLAAFLERGRSTWQTPCAFSSSRSSAFVRSARSSLLQRAMMLFTFSDREL